MHKQKLKEDILQHLRPRAFVTQRQTDATLISAARNIRIEQNAR